MYCRFENRLSGRALQLVGFCQRIEARRAADVAPALAAIEAARQSGRWVALLLDYELGNWLLPETALTAATAAREPAAAAGAAAERPQAHPPACAQSASGRASQDGPASGRPLLQALVFDGALRETPWPIPEEAGGRIASMAPRMDEADYLRAVQALREEIASGDFYQVNYTLPIDLKIQGDPRELYARIAQRHPVAHAAYIEDGTRSVLSFSPELFVSRRGATLTTRPMKGTAPRDPDPATDAALGQALMASEKNRAENLMIVDLLRNDLGRVAQPGSVRVEALFSLEKYPSVWTLTSTVTAQAPHATLEQVLYALFPCGSVTGAPKVAAMRRIQATEVAPRGLYCGSIGWLAPNGDFSFSVAIRTLVVDGAGNGIYGVGGGIVHDSDPRTEWQECLWKARILHA